MIRRLIAALLLASCATAAHAQAYPLAVSLNGLSFTRPSPAYVQDRLGVWLPLAPGEPGFAGGRRVRNLVDQLRALPDGRSSYSIAGGCITIQHEAGQNGSPYIYNALSGDPGDQPPSYFAGRLRFRVLSGPTSDKWSFVGRTWGTAIGSESNNANATLDASTWRTVRQTAEQHERHQGYAMTLLSGSTVARSYEVCDLQFEDLAGEPVPVSSEYVVGTQWFTTERGTLAQGAVRDAFAGTNAFTPAGGPLQDAPGAPLDVRGLWIEPERTNTALWSVPDAGVAVLDGASDSHAWPAPAQAGSPEILLDPRSGRWVYRAALSVAQDQITGPGLGQFAAGQCVWLHVLGAGTLGPVRVLEAQPALLRVDTLLPTVAATGNVARVPCVGDRLGLRRNDGSMHYSTVQAVALPALSPATAIDGYQHQSVRITLADALPADGINAGWRGNENQPVLYHGNDLPVTIKQGIGASVRLVRDESVVPAGLGYLLRSRQVYELAAGPVYAVFDFAGGPGVAGQVTTASAWMRTVAGKPATLSLKAHVSAAISTPAWSRVAQTTTNLSGIGSLRIVVPAGSAVRVALPQVEVGHWASSPIVTGATPATRAAAALTLPAGDWWADLTPAAGGATQRVRLADGPAWGAVRNVSLQE